MVFRKWDGSAHWEYDALLLGEDHHGTWLGVTAGSALERPGASFLSPQDFVTLVPRGRAFLASFYDPVERVSPTGSRNQNLTWSPVELYVDMTTVPALVGGQVQAVDLDLDVLRGRSGRVWVDDEDEFARHRVSLGYPDDVVALARRTCDEVTAEASAWSGPFDGEAAAWWLNRLALLRAS